ncbi:Uncharacterised protein [Mesomycoplasma dispar]|uniref:Uncharacterized protein n=1 Tax=Mesomycoplasma dispar TaxID=86660 RepID=A0AAJ5TCE7_9BACT|nr:hypothetical protein [Mesomycoplasma dispar]AJR12067.1 hypothetical protein MDIS_01110 [Mesomycoplasma dispar]VEU61426.1 Uncharacterised protein [Mesomycoplasma dispar]
MEIHTDLMSNAKKRLLIELKYLEIDIKSFCSTLRIIPHHEGFFECNDLFWRIPNFLWTYIMDFCSGAINPIEIIIGINYKQEDYVYNLRLEDIPKTVFFSKELKNFHFYDDIKCLIDDWENEEYCLKNKNQNEIITPQVYFSETIDDSKDERMVVVAFENFDDLEKCEFSISYPTIFRQMFKSKDKLKEIENLIIKEIQESVPYAKPKNLENYQEKIFDFLSKRYEYNSEFVDVNKEYLGKNLENIYNLLLKENYYFGKESQIHPIKNVFTFESYHNLLEKFKKYGIKKLDLNIENRDKFILSWFDKFGAEYRKYCTQLFGKEGQFYYDNLNKWTNKIEFIYLLQILFGPRYEVDLENLIDPDYFILESWAKLKLENFQIFYFGGEEYGLFDEIISKFDSKKPVFWFKPYYHFAYRTDVGWLSPTALKNFILLYVGEGKIYYWFCHSNLYDDIYQGKYQILKYYFKEKLVKLEREIFLRDGKDPQFFFDLPKKDYPTKNLIESSIDELFLFRDAVEKFLELQVDKYTYFSDFIKDSKIYNEQEKAIILRENFDFSDENRYFKKMAKIDFRGKYSKKAQEDEKMFAELFPGKRKLY